jgi:hypothetical protein
VTDEPALTFGERTLDVGELIEIGKLTGTWPAFVAATQAGLALEGRDVPAADVRAGATAFRYERGLLAAADFRRWLEEARLTSADLAGVLRRRLLRERHPWPDATPDIAPVLRAELICTGTMATLVREATDRLAAQRALGDAAPPDLDDALQVFAAQAARDEDVRRRLAQHRIDWLRIAGEEVAFAHEGAAREARLLVREGEPIADVARLAGVTATTRERLVGAAPPAVAGALAAAVPGELVGPWEQDGEWRLTLVTGKLAPDADDPELRERASRELLAEALARFSAGQLRRHVPV